jgi:pyruvate formate-lyase activating enzyme-like uncharacterized protein
MCANGSKMVILITGLCPAQCYYCPLSKAKQNKDVIFADEWQLSNEEDMDTLIAEARLINATGAGITGGDPLIVAQRTISYIRFLKKSFGQHFHIHLYTSGLTNTDTIKDMVKIGLDEIRFHPEPKQWTTMNLSSLRSVIKKTTKLPVKTALEIPVIPGKGDEIISLIYWADQQHVDYINLNELEFSEQNETALYKKGFNLKNELSSAVKESQETAYVVLNHFEEHLHTIGIHYCSSSFKDGVQLTNRMKRRAQNIASDRDIITDEGTILKGIIEPSQKKTLKEIENFLKSKVNLSKNEFCTNLKKQRIEIHPDVLEQNSTLLRKYGFKCFIIEEYPTADQLEVERTPLPFSSSP